MHAQGPHAKQHPHGLHRQDPDVHSGYPIDVLGRAQACAGRARAPLRAPSSPPETPMPMYMSPFSSATRLARFSVFSYLRESGGAPSELLAAPRQECGGAPSNNA